MKLVRPAALTALFALLFAQATFAPAQKGADKPKEAESPFKNLKYRLIGPAAGGRVCRACGIPGDPSIYYAATAAGGVWKSTDAGITWKSIFDDQPTSTAGSIAVAPSDPNVIYVGSGEANIRGNVQPGNGIYKSTDAGKTWKHVWKQKGQIGKMVAHPTNPDIAYAAVLGSAFGPNPERGVYRTSDGGKSWQQVLTHKALAKVEKVKVQIVRERGKGPNGVDVPLTPGTKVEYREEAKETWDYPAGAIDIAFDPANPRILFAALWQARRQPWALTSGGPGSGLYRSDDAGDTWTKVGPDGKNKDGEENGLPEGVWGRVGIGMAPSDSRRIYVLVEAEKGGLYRSDDGGDNWSLVNAGRYLRQRPFYFTTVHVHPENPDILWCPSVRLLKSIDGGKTFKTQKGPHHADHHDLWIDPKNGRRMIDCNDGGVDITINAGETWHAPLLPISQFYHISVDSSVPYYVMGNMQDQGTARGPSNSLSSAGLLIHDWQPVGGGETGFTVADPRDPNIIYSGEYGGYLSRYDHRTRQARNITAYPYNQSGKGGEELKHRFQWTAPLLISPNDPKTIYHGAEVLFASNDEGTTWKIISPDLTRNDKSKQKWSGGPITGDNVGTEIYCTIFALAESPKQAGVLWAGSDDGLVHVTRDGGKSWENVTKYIAGLPEWGTVKCIEASPHDAGTAYVVVDAHRLDDNRPYLWKTTDFGKSWKNLAAKLPQEDYLNVIREDTVGKNGRLLFVGSRTGVHVSRDDGQSWDRLKLYNLPTAEVSDMQVKGNDLVVGTSGRSVWILDDITFLREWKAEHAKEAQFYSVSPAIAWRYSGELYTPEDRHPGENPPKGAILTYHFEKKPKEDITLEIFDKDGVRVQKLSSKKQDPEAEEDAPDVPWSIFKPTVLPKEAGMNRVAWDLTQEGPKVIPGAKNDAGVPFRGPLVLPGTYTLKLNVDGRTLTQKVEVHPDPRPKTPQAELVARHDFVMKLHKDISTLSQTVIDLQGLRTQLKDRKEVWKDMEKAKELMAPIDKLLTRLETLEEKLHNPKAEVTYDILAMKGGAKLYSQLTPIYAAAMESDGPVTQGLRETYADLAKELAAGVGEWNSCREDLARINERAKALEIPNISPNRDR